MKEVSFALEASQGVSWASIHEDEFIDFQFQSFISWEFFFHLWRKFLLHRCFVSSKKQIGSATDFKPAGLIKATKSHGWYGNLWKQTKCTQVHHFNFCFFNQPFYKRLDLSVSQNLYWFAHQIPGCNKVGQSWQVLLPWFRQNVVDSNNQTSSLYVMGMQWKYISSQCILMYIISFHSWFYPNLLETQLDIPS